MAKVFCVVTVTEGGADFSDYTDPDAVPIDTGPYGTAPEDAARIREQLRNAKPGERITLDGCAECFTLRSGT